MNIVYLLTNTSKTSGTRFYIGSKTECAIIEINSIPTIVSLRDNKPYYSSSSSTIFHSDFKRGDVFVATLLEEVPNKAFLLNVENKYILKNNAVESDEYYNLSQATLGGYMYDGNAPKNIYGETIKSYAQNESNSSKRRARAKKLGFTTYGDLAFYIYNEYKIHKSYQKISTTLKEGRHFARQFISNWNMQECENQLKTIDRKQKAEDLRKLIFNGCSLKRAAELLCIGEPVAEILNNQFSICDKKFSVAIQKGLTNEELEKIVAIDILKNKLGFQECAKKQGITILNAQRYFLRYVRKRLDTNDI